MELKKQTECLANIQLAKENSYPAEKLPKLLEREEKCKNMKPIDSEYTPEKFFKLTYPANPKIPFIIDSLECRQTKYGYGIFTTRDLNPGDIISIEQPTFSIMIKAAQYIRCCNCFKSSMMNLLPCLKSASIMFCSTQCRESIYKKFKNLDDVLCEYKNGKFFNCTKALVDMDEAFDGREKLVDFLKSNNLKKFKKTIFDYDWSNMTDLQRKETLFKCLLSFNDDFFIVSIDFNCSRENTQGNRLVIDAVKRFAKIASKLGVLFESYSANFDKVQEGSTVFNFSNIIKHSCQSNTSYITPNHDQVIYVTRPIKEGEELTINAL